MQNLGRKPERKRPHGRPGHTHGEDNLKWVLKE
jgi:hypothetical protein